MLCDRCGIEKGSGWQTEWMVVRKLHERSYSDGTRAHSLFDPVGSFFVFLCGSCEDAEFRKWSRIRRGTLLALATAGVATGLLSRAGCFVALGALLAVLVFLPLGPGREGSPERAESLARSFAARKAGQLSKGLVGGHVMSAREYSEQSSGAR